MFTARSLSAGVGITPASAPGGAVSVAVEGSEHGPHPWIRWFGGKWAEFSYTLIMSGPTLKLAFCRWTASELYDSDPLTCGMVSQLACKGALSASGGKSCRND